MTLAENADQRNYQHLVDQLYQTSDFDFVGVALQASQTPHQITWQYVAGNQGEQFRKIILRSGIGIAGLVVRTGKPFWKNALQDATYTDALYTPIAQAEGLTSAAAIPIVTTEFRLVTGVLLAGYRSTQTVSDQTISRLSHYLATF